MTRDGVPCRCPPFPFKLAKTVDYTTFDHRWHPSNEFITKVQWQEMDVLEGVNASHFTSIATSDDVMLYEALRKERELTSKLRTELDDSVIVERQGTVLDRSRRN